MAEYLYGINPVSEALTGQGRKAKEIIVVRGKHSPRLAELLEQARVQNIPIANRERRDLDRLAGNDHHQGVLLRLEPFVYAEFGDLLNRWQKSGRPAFFLILDGITDPHNLGAILRSAEVAGCHGVILAKDRSCPVTPVVEKTAAGALSHLPLCQVTNLARTLEQLKQENVWCYGLAGEEDAKLLYQSDLRGNVALVVGSEGRGLRPNVRNHCDGLISIPMQGQIGSLNASVAAAVALFEVVRQGGGSSSGRSMNKS